MTVPNVADRIDTPASGAGEPLLLHSMAVFWELIVPLLDAVQPARLCEIGVSTGQFSARLIAHARAHGGTYTGIDPALDPAVEARLAAPDARFVRQPSLDALAAIEPADAYFVDGDHNYHTVFGELTAIFSRGAPRLIVLHDTAWPWGRRDQYCDPDRIPEAARHRFTRGGYVHPDHARARGEPPGFRGVDSEYPYVAAIEEGGERNGVLAAVLDVCRAHPELRQIHIPAVFGLSVLYPDGALPTGLEIRLAGGRALYGPLLGRMERNRLKLFFAWTETLRHFDGLQRYADELKMQSEDAQTQSEDLRTQAKDAQTQAEDLRTQAEDAREQWRELKAHFDTLHGQYKTLEAAQAALHGEHQALRETGEHREAAYRELQAAYDNALSVRIARRFAALVRKGRVKDGAS